MRASEIMTRPAVSIRPHSSIRDAIVVLTERGFAGLPVVNDDDQVIGVITEADALRTGFADDYGVAERTVADAMSTPVEVVESGTKVADVARHMLNGGLRCIPVVDDGVLMGVISRRDLLRGLVRQDDAVAAHIRALLTDYSGHRSRWSVEVDAGVATVRGEFTDEAERRVVEALARTVSGVLRVEIRSGAPDQASAS